jgi:hypothetical protein
VIVNRHLNEVRSLCAEGGEGSAEQVFILSVSEKEGSAFSRFLFRALVSLPHSLKARGADLNLLYAVRL